MELSQIKYFIMTAQLQNMSKAAQRLNISQPSLSKSLSKLEADLGTTLFDRSGKKLILNDKGQRFLEGALISLQELEDTSAAVSDLSRGSTSKLSLGIFRSHQLIVNCLEEFSKIYPNVEYTINYAMGPYDRLDTDEFDMLLYPRDASFKKYKGHIVTVETYYLAVHAQSPLSGKIKVNVSELAAEKFIFLRHGPRSIERPYHLCINAGTSPTVRCFTNSIESHRQLISTGLGIGFVAQGSCESYKNDPNIVLIPVTDEEFNQEILIGFKRDKHLSDTGKLFRSHVMKHFGFNEPVDKEN